MVVDNIEQSAFESIIRRSKALFGDSYGKVAQGDSTWEEQLRARCLDIAKMEFERKLRDDLYGGGE